MNFCASFKTFLFSGASLGAVLLLLSVPASAEAPASATADDGRTVQLNSDGSWQYVSDDRYATTVEGRRVRLGADGRWELLPEGSAPAIAAAVLAPVAVVTPTVQLEGVVQEEVKKNAPGGKNVRVYRQLVVRFSVQAAPNAELVPAFDNRFNGIRVVDNLGTAFTIAELTPAAAPIQAGGQQIYELRTTDGLGWGRRSLSLHFEREVFSTPQPVRLVIPTADIVLRSVNALKEVE